MALRRWWRPEGKECFQTFDGSYRFPDYRGGGTPVPAGAKVIARHRSVLRFGLWALGAFSVFVYFPALAFALMGKPELATAGCGSVNMGMYGIMNGCVAAYSVFGAVILGGAAWMLVEYRWPMNEWAHLEAIEK